MASNSDELRVFLIKELECPVCLEVPETTPIFQCLQEHIHCNECHPKLNHCPICRSAIQMDSRNLMAEKIHEKLLQTCGHENCSVRKVNIKEHEAGCEMALVKCSYCQTNVTIRGLGLHEDIECEHRRFKCPHSGCPLEMVAKESQEHKQQCEYRRIQCLICQERVPMKLLFSHTMNIHTSGYFDGSKVVCKQKLQIDKAFKKQFLMKAYRIDDQPFVFDHRGIGCNIFQETPLHSGQLHFRQPHSGQLNFQLRQQMRSDHEKQ